MTRTAKYVGLDVHQATTVVTIRAERGQVMTRAIVSTEAGAFQTLFRGMRGAVQVAFEEGTQASTERSSWVDGAGPVDYPPAYLRTGQPVELPMDGGEETSTIVKWMAAPGGARPVDSRERGYRVKHQAQLD